MVCSLRLGVGGEPTSHCLQTIVLHPSFSSEATVCPLEVTPGGNFQKCPLCTEGSRLWPLLSTQPSKPMPQCSSPPQLADTAWKSLPWFPWKLGTKDHFQGHGSHSDKATLVHTKPEEESTIENQPQFRERRKLVSKWSGGQEGNRETPTPERNELEHLYPSSEDAGPLGSSGTPVHPFR